MDDRKIEKLQRNLHMIGSDSGANARKHKVFVDSHDELETFDPSAKVSAPSSSTLAKSSHEKLPPQTPTRSEKKAKKVLTKVVEKKVRNAYKELEQRQERSKQLTTALNALSLQRHLLGKGSKRKVVLAGGTGDDEDEDNSDGKKVVFKWKRQRQK